MHFIRRKIISFSFYSCNNNTNKPTRVYVKRFICKTYVGGGRMYDVVVSNSKKYFKESLLRRSGAMHVGGGVVD